METSALPLPPSHLRSRVGCLPEVSFQNQNGDLVYPELPPTKYRSVLDFGCGCGRSARLLMQQKVQPQKYLGVDRDPLLIHWCQENLAPLDGRYKFHLSEPKLQGLGRRTVEAFPVENAEVSLLIAHSVFTHLSELQTRFYLSEVARVLAHDGVAMTTWFFFDNPTFNFIDDNPACLFLNDLNPLLAVVYDRKWFLNAVRESGLRVRKTVPDTNGAGFQWIVWLERRTSGEADQFPLEDEAAEWVCGATYKARAERNLHPWTGLCREEKQRLAQQAETDISESEANRNALDALLLELDLTRQNLELAVKDREELLRKLEALTVSKN